VSVRILRVRRPSNLLTARAFEELFDRQIGGAFDVDVAPMREWWAAVLGPPGARLDLDAAGRRLRALTAGYDYVAPNYECMPVAPLLLAARNRARAPVRLLFIAHAAGAYALEWALLRPLLAPGDVVVTPSESARRTVELLCPALAPYLHVINHPMAPLPATARRRGSCAVRPHVVSLGRVHAHKLVHRQIEALAVLRARGRQVPTMDVGGPLDDGGVEGPHPYTRALAAKVARLGLGRHVRFVGAVRGDADKACFLARADVLVNLSTTLEESFPKAPVEALGVGLPVLGTDWNGLRDTVGTDGAHGTLVPVDVPADGVGRADAPAERVADALEALLELPPPLAACREWAARFAPGVVLPRYRAVLRAGADLAHASPADVPAWPDATEPAAPPRGLLAAAAPLTALSYDELFGIHERGVAALRRHWDGEPLQAGEHTRVQRVLASALEPSLERFFADGSLGAAGRAVAASSEPAPPRAWRGLDDRLAASAADGLLDGRVACVAELLATRRPAAVEQAAAALERMPADALGPARGAMWAAELALARGRADEALAVSAAACAALDPRAPHGEDHWPWLRQLARVARQSGQPAAALEALARWLSVHPDAQESGAVSMEIALNAWRAGGAHLADAPGAVGRARQLLGDLPPLLRLDAAVGRASHIDRLAA
jgi:glycosyltransferase involved in cell wall biosynthesis